MKYIKKFENISESFKVGDYAIIKIRRKNVLEKIIVEIVEIVKNPNFEVIATTADSKIRYIVGYEGIICWSENKEELETILDADKYNL